MNKAITLKENKKVQSKGKLTVTLILTIAYSLLSGLAFFDFVGVIDGSYYRYYYSEEGFATLFVAAIIVCLIQFASTVLLCIFTAKKPDSPLSAIPFVGYIASALIFVVANFFAFLMENVDLDFINALLNMIIYSIVALVFVLMAVYSIVAALKPNNKVIKILFFIPALISCLAGVGSIVKWILMLCFGGEELCVILTILVPIPVYLVFTAFVFFFCFRMANPYKKVVTKESAEDESYIDPSVKTFLQSTSKEETEDERMTQQTNNIEFIKQYKELLDMGAITQEEFEEKKKGLLDNE
ncbi:MAG: SHOCT domain-containing protein [Acutalibacteraceae bacterium]|nr:SHOCT domain-containing protein [Acutalibacteraceae bacterium]